MKFKFTLIFFVLIISENCVSSQVRWNSAFYQKYDFESFSKSRLANQKIDIKNIDYPLLHAAIFYETNRQRIINEMPPFQYSAALEKAARQHSIDMVRRNFFSHESPVRGKKNNVHAVDKSRN